MPELPEVETTRRGIAPHITGQRIHQVVIRQPRLRWPVTTRLPELLRNQTVTGVGRRAKYLLLGFPDGHVIIHLGMSGSLCITPVDTPAGRHDHVELQFANGTALRLTDPRRFGSVHWISGDPQRHRLLKTLGPEPWDSELTGTRLYEQSRGRSLAVKNFIMDSHIVVGVGNIYASEALFSSGIHPNRAAGRIGLRRYQTLLDHIRRVLDAAIRAGGTSLRDFVGGTGKPGYFKQQLCVYGRDTEPCVQCGSAIKLMRIGQRASFYCPRCQT